MEADSVSTKNVEIFRQYLGLLPILFYEEFGIGIFLPYSGQETATDADASHKSTIYCQDNTSVYKLVNSKVTVPGPQWAVVSRIYKHQI